MTERILAEVKSVQAGMFDDELTNNGRGITRLL
jgi:hypothetical protein